MAKKAANPSEYAPFLHGIHRDSNLRNAELTYSMLYAASLNRLVPTEHCSFSHQGPVRKKEGKPGNPEMADILGLQFVNDIPGKIMFVADLKKNELELAVKETSLYAKFASLDRNFDPTNCYLVLRLAATADSSNLIVFVIAEKILWAILVIKGVKPWDRTLLATVAIAVTSLSISPVVYKVL